MFSSDDYYIDHIEIVLGGDHGKGIFMFIVAVIVRYTNEKQNAITIDIQIGEIESKTSSIAHQNPLLDLLLP